MPSSPPSTHSGSGDEAGSETVTFAFEKIEKEYTPQGSDASRKAPFL
jgi:type VI protein secretion system component Hcp